MSQDANPADHDHANPIGQLIKFGLLTAVLLGSIFVVNWSRPLIFERIVPAILGLDQGGDSQLVEPPPGPTAVPAGDGSGEPDPAYPGPDAPVSAPASGVGGAATAVPAEQPTAAPAAPRTHTVQAGENLTRIATRYGVTVQALMAANNIVDPNRVYVGDVLTIPAADDTTIFAPVVP